MAPCFQQANNVNNGDTDSVILFSNSDDHYSHEDQTSTASPSSLNNSPPSDHHHTHDDQYMKPTYKLTVTNLSYYTQLPTTSFLPFFSKTKIVSILKSISFTAKSSEIIAIVGPSGTGKSTLLGILSGRVVNHKHYTNFDPKTISINDHPISHSSHLKKICGFVAQEDNLLPLLTVKETLMFAAKFSLKRLGCIERESRVSSLLKELGLWNVAESFVGDEEHRGISGGERKRVSIGVEMIQDPPILLLDEPTSGLDSTSALQVIELLSMVARTKKLTVVLSIHQPSYRILQYISNYLVLSRGSVVHNGSLQSLEETIVGKLGIQIPVQLNALEFALEIVRTLEDYSYSKKDYDTDHHMEVVLWPDREDFGGYEHDQNIGKTTDSTTYCFFANYILEIMFLCSRFWKIIYRTKQLFLARTMQALVGGFGLGSVYVKMRRDEGGVAERLGLFAFSLSFLLSSTVEALPIFLQERQVLMKESSRGAYRISSYMIANTVVFLPFLFAVAIIFAVPLYWIVGLNPSSAAFLFFTLVVWLILLMASSLVLFLSAVSPDFISGNSLICTVLGAFFLFSGYFIPKESIPKYWIFMYYVSLYRYPLDSLLTNEYWSLRSKCFNWNKESVDGQPRCLLTGNDVLKSRGLEDDPRWINVGIMLGFFVFYRLLGWIILSRRSAKTTF
ncbi:ABC transporter G family member 23 [Humulus lupulus]|uniref:ABC transporter G family member 23 n=1 Tax=Humulus lupulus TaxID=3486 RepID=UPI002B4062C9|nr:ABC transporter G family member 23 [Humulus lupulus]